MLDFVDPSASSQTGGLSQADGLLQTSGSPQADGWPQVDGLPQVPLESPVAVAHPLQGELDLNQGSFEDRWEAAKQISHLGEAAIRDLIAMLSDDRLAWETRWFAARSLGSFDQPPVVTALIEALGTADEDLQEAIIEALCHIGPSAIQALSALLTQPTYQTIAIEALTRIPHPATQIPLAAAVDLTTGGTQAKVIEALGQFADLDLLPIFTEAAQNRASSVRLAALQGFIHLRTQVDESHWVAWMQPLTKDVHPAVAQRAIHALGRTTHLAATQALQGVLTAAHTPNPLKTAAVQALAWQGTAAALGVLIQRWDTLGQDTRIALVQGLFQITRPDLKAQISPPVQQWLNRLPATADHSLLRRNLVMLLGQMGDDAALPILHTLSQDADAGVRFHAEAALRSAPTLGWGDRVRMGSESV